MLLHAERPTDQDYRGSLGIATAPSVQILRHAQFKFPAIPFCMLSWFLKKNHSEEIASSLLQGLQGLVCRMRALRWAERDR